MHLRPEELAKLSPCGGGGGELPVVAIPREREAVGGDTGDAGLTESVWAVDCYPASARKLSQNLLLILRQSLTFRPNDAVVSKGDVVVAISALELFTGFVKGAEVFEELLLGLDGPSTPVRAKLLLSATKAGHW